MTRPLRIAVVGHTNTGKTSLLRTLTRDTGFGEVSSRPGTTRHVEGARLLVDGDALVELYDTPGMEDPIALLECLESIAPPADERLDGPARIARFLADEPAHGRFEQEAKVLRQLLASDAAFYVVDARDPVLAKHRDELAILAGCAIPLLPVLNFVRDVAANECSWREALARLGLHAVVRFDTVAPGRDGERRLYETLATLLDAWRPALERLVAHREREARQRRAAALEVVADLLIDVAAVRIAVPTEPQTVRRAIGDLHELVRRREQACVDALLALYRFHAEDLDAAHLPLLDGRWETDLFHPDALRAMGVRLGTGAAAGAAAGLGVDVMVGGLTLGAAAALGALAGGGWQALRHYGDRLFDRLLGQRELTVEDAIVRLLALRGLHLVQVLDARGHAAMTPVGPADPHSAPWREGGLPDVVRAARAYPQWSGLIGAPRPDAERHEAVRALAAVLAESLDR